MKRKQYSHMFDVAFTLSNDTKGGATNEQLITALEKRLLYLKGHPEELQEACGLVDTYQESIDTFQKGGSHEN